MKPSSHIVPFLYPLSTICVIFFFKSFSIVWLINFALLYVIYRYLWWCSGHIFAVFQISDFYNEFIGKRRNFDLQPIEKEKIKLDFVREFGWLIFNYNILRQKASILTTTSFINLPLLFFYAIPKKNKILASSKAYMYSPGQYFIVNRTKEIDRNPFEIFLFNHEIQHVNDIGLRFYRQVARLRMRFMLTLLMFTPFLTNVVNALVLVFYVFIAAGGLFVKPIALGEMIADHGGLLSLKSGEDRMKVYLLLKKSIERQYNKGGFWNRRIYALRYRLLHYNLSLIGDLKELTEEERLYNKHAAYADFNYHANEPETIFCSLLLIIAASFAYVDSILFLKGLAVALGLFIIMYFFSIWRSSLYYKKIIKSLFSRFKTDDFYLPFSNEKNFQNLTLKELIDKKLFTDDFLDFKAKAEFLRGRAK